MVVESLNGPSPFTQDPNRHRLMEATVSLPTHIKPSTILPDRQTANVLVESYFTNVLYSSDPQLFVKWLIKFRRAV